MKYAQQVKFKRKSDPNAPFILVEKIVHGQKVMVKVYEAEKSPSIPMRF